MPTALIVEPNKFKAKGYADALSLRKIETAWAPDAEKDLQHCASNAVDVLVSRVILGEMTGYEIIAAVRVLQSIPALVISMYPMNMIQSVREFDRGIPLMLEPFTDNDLAAAVEALLGRNNAASV